MQRTIADLRLTYPTAAGEEIQIFGHAEEFLVEIDKLKPQELGAYWNVASNLHQGQPLASVSESLRHFSDNANYQGFRQGFENAAIRLMALECSAFHQELLVQETVIRNKWDNAVFEPFIPFKAWARALGESDALIIFNYDMVAEFFVPPNSGAQIIKMHGSVVNPSVFGKIGYTGLVESTEVPDIGIPGTMKANKDYKAAWREAAKALESAEHVIFLGYGLPESDAYARAFLLQHLRKNGQRILDVEFVLGEPGPRTNRLTATIAMALAHRTKDKIKQAENTQLVIRMEDKIAKHQSTSHPSSTQEYEQYKYRRKALSGNLATLNQFRGINLLVPGIYTQDYMQSYATMKGITPNLETEEDKD